MSRRDKFVALCVPNCSKKGKVAPVFNQPQHREEVWGEWGIAPSILTWAIDGGE